ncbi:MAG: TerC family protein [Planctomycetia bacterium]|nr:TerC family protein [Planctomycetia bacterium]
MEITFWHWLAFGGLVVALLALDLGVFHRKSRDTSLREAALFTCLWVAIALAFNLVVWYLGGSENAVLFFTGYLVEWSLSMDNVFVFAVIFSYFRVPLKYQYRVLFWGILGAIVMRLTFVLAGAGLINRFEWILYLLGAFLIYTAIKLAMSEEQTDPEHGWTLRLMRRFLPISKENHGELFFVREGGRWAMTPLFVVLIVIDTTDFAFAMDSVPAIFGITKDPFIVFTSNVFAILGLRALYFLLAGVMDLFRYLRYGLSAILFFVGAKMLLGWVADPPEWYVNQFGMPPEWARHWIGHPPAWASLVVVLSLLAVSILASLVGARLEAVREAAQAGQPAKRAEATKARSN